MTRKSDGRLLAAAAFVLLLISGCSRETADRPAGEPTVVANELSTPHAAPTDGRTATDPVSPVPLENPEEAFAAQLVRLGKAADEHEERGYFEQAITSRAAMLRLIEDRYGADAWQARSGRLALAHSRTLKDFTPEQRAAEAEIRRLDEQAATRWAKAEHGGAFESIVEARRRTAQLWGADDFTVANLLLCEAQWRQALGDLAAAEPLLRQAWTLRERLFTRAHPEALAAESSLGLLMQAAGRPAEAEPLLRETVRLAPAAWGPLHAETATHLHNLGVLLKETRQHAEAISLLSQAAQIRRTTLGPTDPLLAHSLLNLGSVHYASKDLAPAEAAFREALSIFEPALGSGHRLTRLARVNLAFTCMARQNFSQAQTLLAADRDVVLQTYGPDHAEFAESLTRLATLYGNQGRYDEALKLVDQALAIHSRSAAPDERLTQGVHALAERLRSAQARRGAVTAALPEPGNERR